MKFPVVVIAVMALTSALIVLSALWIIPVVAGQNSVCQHYPLFSGCR